MGEATETTTVSKSKLNEPLCPTAAQIKDMQHMLGMTGSAPKGQWGYRNHYAASHGNTQVLESMAQLVNSRRQNANYWDWVTHNATVITGWRQRSGLNTDWRERHCTYCGLSKTVRVD